MASSETAARTSVDHALFAQRSGTSASVREEPSLCWTLPRVFGARASDACYQTDFLARTKSLGLT
jgi:hypothetical protein